MVSKRAPFVLSPRRRHPSPSPTPKAPPGAQRPSRVERACERKAQRPFTAASTGRCSVGRLGGGAAGATRASWRADQTAKPDVLGSGEPRGADGRRDSPFVEITEDALFTTEASTRSELRPLPITRSSPAQGTITQLSAARRAKEGPGPVKAAIMQHYREACRGRDGRRGFGSRLARALPPVLDRDGGPRRRLGGRRSEDGHRAGQGPVEADRGAGTDQDAEDKGVEPGGRGIEQRACERRGSSEGLRAQGAEDPERAPSGSRTEPARDEARRGERQGPQPEHEDPTIVAVPSNETLELLVKRGWFCHILVWFF